MFKLDNKIPGLKLKLVWKNTIASIFIDAASAKNIKILVIGSMMINHKNKKN
jgi:hypothetical protein